MARCARCDKLMLFSSEKYCNECAIQVRIEVKNRRLAEEKRKKEEEFQRSVMEAKRIGQEMAEEYIREQEARYSYDMRQKYFHYELEVYRLWRTGEYERAKTLLESIPAQYRPENASEMFMKLDSQIQQKKQLQQSMVASAPQFQGSMPLQSESANQQGSQPALKCEICGDSSILWKSGIYVCQTCGVQYSADDLKRMLVSPVAETAKTEYDLDSEGMPEDSKEAFQFYLSAAQGEDPRGMQKVASAYFYGRGVAKDYSEAAKWYERAALKGNKKSQYVLGRMYLEGYGKEKDNEQAVYWMKMGGIPDRQIESLLRKFGGSEYSCKPSQNQLIAEGSTSINKQETSSAQSASTDEDTINDRALKAKKTYEQVIHLLDQINRTISTAQGEPNSNYINTASIDSGITSFIMGMAYQDEEMSEKEFDFMFSVIGKKIAYNWLEINLCSSGSDCIDNTIWSCIKADNLASSEINPYVISMITAYFNIGLLFLWCFPSSKRCQFFNQILEELCRRAERDDVLVTSKIDQPRFVVKNGVLYAGSHHRDYEFGFINGVYGDKNSPARKAMLESHDNLLRHYEEIGIYGKPVSKKTPPPDYDESDGYFDGGDWVSYRNDDYQF